MLMDIVGESMDELLHGPRSCPLVDDTYDLSDEENESFHDPVDTSLSPDEWITPRINKLDILTHRTESEINWLENVLDTIQNDNDDFKPCIATLKFDKSTSCIYDLHDNIPPYNYMDNNNHWIDKDSVFEELPVNEHIACCIGGALFDEDDDELDISLDNNIKIIL